VLSLQMLEQGLRMLAYLILNLLHFAGTQNLCYSDFKRRTCCFVVLLLCLLFISKGTITFTQTMNHHSYLNFQQNLPQGYISVLPNSMVQDVPE
jgi:hypothetical protein